MVPFTLRGLDHVVIRVKDPEASLRFYLDVLGCTFEAGYEKLGFVQVRAGDSLIDLIDLAGKFGRDGGGMPVDDGRNMDHFALRITEFDEPALRAHFASFGIEATETRHIYAAEGIGPSLFVHDPDGNTVELKGPSERSPK